MKKLFQIVAVLTITCSSASAHLIHSLHIKNPGARGYKDVGQYEGFFINRKWCLNPGTINCPYLVGDKMIPNGDAGNASHDLANFERQFIKQAMIDAGHSDLTSGLITEVFEVNGEKVVLTAQFSKDEEGYFLFDVVKNNSYEANLKELSSIEL